MFYLRGRGTQPLLQHDGREILKGGVNLRIAHHRSHYLDLLGDRLLAEVELLVPLEGPGQQHHARHVGRVHRPRLGPGQEADCPRVLEHAGLVLPRRTVDDLQHDGEVELRGGGDLEISVDEAGPELPGGTEV